MHCSVHRPSMRIFGMLFLKQIRAREVLVRAHRGAEVLSCGLSGGRGVTEIPGIAITGRPQALQLECVLVVLVMAFFVVT